jgi:hypothetical protein
MYNIKYIKKLLRNYVEENVQHPAVVALQLCWLGKVFNPRFA